MEARVDRHVEGVELLVWTLRMSSIVGNQFNTCWSRRITGMTSQSVSSIVGNQFDNIFISLAGIAWPLVIHELTHN